MSLKLSLYFLCITFLPMVSYLIGDIGGTKSLFQYHFNGEIKSKSYLNRDFPTFESLLENLKLYLNLKTKNEDLLVTLAVAAPIIEVEIRMTNLDWRINKDEVKKLLGITNLYIINDLHSVGEYIARADRLKYLPLKLGGFKRPSNTFLVVGVGTGFGVAQGICLDDAEEYHQEDVLIPIDSTKEYKIVPSEAGHGSFSPSNFFQKQLLENLENHLKTVTIEDVCSSRGIFNIYKFMTEGTDIEDRDHKKRMDLEKDQTREILRHTKGRSKCHICYYVIENMMIILAHKLRDLALQTLPYQGIFLFGGIIQNSLSYLNSKLFLETFRGVDITQSELYQATDSNHQNTLKIILDKIPIYIITANDAPIQGGYLKMLDG